MNLTEELKTNNWQMSSDQQGVTSLGIDDINQCILNIINTQKGSDPVNPIFGVDLMNYIDKPAQQIAPVLMKDLLDSINTWEKRIKVDKITYQIIESNIIFDIQWSMDNLTGQIQNSYATS